VRRSLPAPVGDVALLVTRVLLGAIMLAHGYQKLVVNGIGRTTEGFESMSIPVAIVSASFVTVVEVVGGVLLILGLLTTVVAGCMGFVMAGAALFVHAKHGVFVSEGGWELVGSIAGALLAVATAGPGRFTLPQLVRARRRPPVPEAVPVPPPVPTPYEQDFIPPPGLPVTPLVRFEPESHPWRPAPEPAVGPERPAPLPVRRPPASARRR
jgi:putative oxidoreductase